jgi:hypothetical protein
MSFFPIPWNKMMIAVDKCFAWKLWYVCYYVYDCDMLHDYGYYGYDSVMFMRMMIGVHWGYSIWLVGIFHNYLSLCLFWSTMGTLSSTNTYQGMPAGFEASSYWLLLGCHSSKILFYCFNSTSNPVYSWDISSSRSSKLDQFFGFQFHVRFL